MNYFLTLKEYTILYHQKIVDLFFRVADKSRDFSTEDQMIMAGFLLCLFFLLFSVTFLCGLYCRKAPEQKTVYVTQRIFCYVPTLPREIYLNDLKILRNGKVLV